MEKNTRSNRVLKARTLRVFTRHPSHSSIRNSIRLPFLACLRLGSLTAGTLPYKVEINTPEAIKNSSSKLLMKQCFTRDKVKTADWWIWVNNKLSKVIEYNDASLIKFDANLPIEFPIVAKRHFGSRGEGNTLIKTQEEFDKWKAGKPLERYIFERFHNYTREYRLHVDSEGCFYTCRKMLKEGTPDDQKWHRHDSNSVWIMEENPSFDKPSNWASIVEHSVKALKAVGLDVGAIDLKVQSAKDHKGINRKEPEFIVIEINSAPSFGDVTVLKYKQQIPIIAKRKYESLYKS